MGQWHFDTDQAIQGGGDSTPDSSGFGRDLQSCCTIALSDGGRWGKYLAENNYDELETTTASGLPLQRVTLLAWIKKTANPNQDEVVAGQGYDSTTCNALSYALYSGGDSGDLVYFQIRQPGSSGDVEVQSPVASFADDGNWHLVVGTFDGSTVRLYVDGAQVGSGTPTSTSSISYGTTQGPFGVDGYGGGSAPVLATPNCPAGQDFTGGLDELRVYDRALSATEIYRLATATGTTPPDLVPDQTSPPPPPPPPKPVASFTEPTAPVGFLHQAILDASGTKNATKLVWNITGGGHTETLNESANDRFLAIRLPTPANYRVKLTAIGSSGLTSSTYQTLHINGSTGPARLAATINPPVTSISGASIARSISGGDLSQILCSAAGGQTIVFQVLQAQGCFNTITDLNKVPAPEQLIARTHYDDYTQPAVVAAICTKAANGQLPQSECDDAKKFFAVDLNDAYSTAGDVMMNGLKVHPILGAHVVLFPSDERVICSLCTITWGAIPVFAGPLDLNMTLIHLVGGVLYSSADAGYTPLFNFDASRIGSVADFTPTGSVSLELHRNGGNFWSQGSVNLSLPNEFSFLGSQAPSASITLTGTNSSAPVLDHLALSVPEANLGAVDLTDLSFRYELKGGIDDDTNPVTSCNYKEWKATGNAFLDGSPDPSDRTGLRMTPPPSQNGVEFCAGGFKAAGAVLQFGPEDQPEIFPGVFIRDINFGIQLNPTLIRGGVGLDVGQLVKIDGAALVVFATTTHTYYLSAGDAGNEFAVLAGRTFSSTTIAVGGDVYMRVPIFGLLKMGSGAMMYSYPDYLYADGQVLIVVPGFSISGEVGGEVDLGTKKFQFHGGVQGCLAGIHSPFTCAGADGWVGSRGMAVCLDIGGLHPGAGVRWDGFFNAWPFDGCKPSEFWETNIHAAEDRVAGAAAGGVTVTLAKGEGVKNIKLVGAGSSPEVTVTSPDGRKLTITGDRFEAGNNMAGFLHPYGNLTFIGIRGTPGVYRIDPLPGSAPIAQLFQTREGYDTNITARVLHHGRQYVLSYDARRPEGQLVTFAERGANVFKTLGQSRGGRGRIRFTPALGPGGRRQIVAMITLDGTPIPDQTLATYVAPGIPKLGRPGRVRVRRRGTVLNVSWTAARGATRYAVVLRLSNGSTHAYKLGPGRRSLRITRVPLYLSGIVQVTAQGILRNWGPPTSARFKNLALPPTLLQTNTHNERIAYLAYLRKLRKRPRPRR